MIQNDLEKQQLTDRLERASADINRSLIESVKLCLRTCVVCDHWNQLNETCSVNNLRPPANIIAFGCECFVNEIPF